MDYLGQKGSGTNRLATKGELSQSSSDIEITDATKGIILRAGDGTRARITLVNTAEGLALQITAL